MSGSGIQIGHIWCGPKEVGPEFVPGNPSGRLNDKAVLCWRFALPLPPGDRLGVLFADLRQGCRATGGLNCSVECAVHARTKHHV